MGLPETAPDQVPWGTSLVEDRRLLLEQWRDLDAADRSGLPPAERERIAAAKLATFDRASVARARAVNELLAILRWAVEDAPGTVEALLADVVGEITRPDLVELADAVVRVEERLDRGRTR